MTTTEVTKVGGRHFGVLDGWRAISIVMVLAGHLLPLGPKRFAMNESVAASGMALFFTLSGFLITTFLLRSPDVRSFLIRRFCRIVPLAWVYCLIVFVAVGAAAPVWAAHFFFYANLPPFWLIDGTAHLWSLCVEVQFYVGIAVVVALLGRKGLWLMPLLCLAVTAYRVVHGEHISIVTWFRVDEILAGSTLALLLARWPSVRGVSAAWPVMLVGLALMLASAHPAGGPLAYLRPYIAATLVGITLYAPATSFSNLLCRREFAYLAKVSFALYVIHGGLTTTWLASGDTLVKYLKRPLFFAVLFVLAHVSTFHFEQRWIDLGHRWSRRPRRLEATPGERHE
jgi:peptidoglycan/LPS O-acetylase OafA/YrhL